MNLSIIVCLVPSASDTIQSVRVEWPLPRSIASDGSLGITEAGADRSQRRGRRAQKSLDLSRRCEIHPTAEKSTFNSLLFQLLLQPYQPHSLNIVRKLFMRVTKAEPHSAVTFYAKQTVKLAACSRFVAAAAASSPYFLF